ncbi:hypothetical protein BDV28DRAFT_147149 [Aspergillus coremiiformis]|uniref:GPI ethanolamine phosphate transferase 2 C-terminal domain-containing protein n=1 Tax=Aspergillus coremiiformis TaxID=138285 RepID=A0A5N6ZAG9_9EURO|nr:hypothetical protein BDV28DRAFT_147149 [Aspergillus coremiiformis]
MPSSAQRVTPIFLLWILYEAPLPLRETIPVLLSDEDDRLIHLIGLYLFTKGFLLSRTVLENKSECTQIPVMMNTSKGPLGKLSSIDRGCWFPKAFDKAILLVIDALRFDFTIPFNDSVKTGTERAQPFHDVLTVLYETAIQEPGNAMLLPFIADPPTTTLQRLKGLTTGTLPTFIEAGSNFAGSAILEDNIVTQLRDAGKRLVHIGDDTWTKLFPGHFVDHLSQAYDSFLVEDLHTVDDGVTRHLNFLLHAGKDEWDVIFAHFLGVDHVGHRYGPAHPEMNAKLKQMDDVIRGVVDALDDDTLLIVLGDHGMDAHGNHGGETDDEIQAALWMYTRRKHFGHLQNGFNQSAGSIAEMAVPQIDLVPTLSLLLGVPIPFNNLGSPIKGAFIGERGEDWERLIHAALLASGQIDRFQKEYAHIQGTSSINLQAQARVLDTIKQAWTQIDAENRRSSTDFYQMLDEHQRSALHTYKNIWAQFNTTSMLKGVLVLLLAASCLLLRLTFLEGNLRRTSFSILSALKTGILAGTMVGGAHIALVAPNRLLVLDSIIFGTAAGIIASSGHLYDFPGLIRSGGRYRNLSPWNWLAVMFTAMLSFGFASNSYVIWEAKIVLIFLSTFATCTVFASSHRSDTTECIVGTFHSMLFFLLNRIASLSKYCREEQLPFCVTTYDPAGDSFGWRLLVPFATAILVPRITTIAFKSDIRSLNTPQRLWLHKGFPTALLLNALHWALIGAEDDRRTVAMFINRIPRRMVAQCVIAISVIGLALLSFASSSWRSSRLYTSSFYGRYLIFSMSTFLLCLLVSNPMGAGSLTILYFQLLSLRQLLPSKRSYAIKATVAALLGSLHFFSTGHNATLSSIQWKAAYIPFQDLHYPWSPLLVVLNTFAGPIVAASAVPLVVSNDERQSSTNASLTVAKALTVHVLVYNVWALSTAIWASILRRHLMLFAIFCPRFLMAGILLLIVDVIACSTSLITTNCTK